MVTWSLYSLEGLQGVGPGPVGIPGGGGGGGGSSGQEEAQVESQVGDQVVYRPEQKQFRQPGSAGSVERNCSAVH